MIQVPTAFAASTVAREGAAGRLWINSLPQLIEELCSVWGLTPAGPVRHGYVGVVVPVTREGITLALKVSWIDESSKQEALVLRAWNGRGAVRLLEAREESGALLLEWLDPDRTLATVPPDAAAEIAGGLLRRLAIAAPEQLRTVREEIDHLVGKLRARWQDSGRPFSEVLLDHAMAVCVAGRNSDDHLIVNQDLHYDNVLAGAREPWSVIDPKALAGDTEFGVAPLLWNRFEELGDRAGLERRLQIIADAADLDLDAGRRWAVVRLVDYWLWALNEGFTEDPSRCSTLIKWLVPGFAG
jgi:streptomycin 6-kinase